MDEQYYTGFPAAPYPQQFLNDILRMQGDFSGVHDANAAACYSNPHAAFPNGEASKEGIEIKMENQGATTSDMRMEVISAVAEVAKYAQNRTPQMENGAQKGPGANGVVQQVPKPISAHSTTSPISSPEVNPSGNANRAQQQNGFSDESDSDDDESSDSESDDAKCSSSHGGQKCPGVDVEADNNELFAILKKKIERQVPRKRLRYLRRIRRQLNYFLQMHE
ncbi:unnamed protein product, partial [Gongylonema pulchrum]|uniref:BHLH domain-containing protein n=1 Tax=Gongylonema pulchrum TaxID=637853 RepID=A0A183EI53_9BILA